jgi:hypothetical protein
MGLFKAMKDAKALGDYHGGRPSMKDAFKDISALADDRGEGEVLKNGTPTKAVVQGFPSPVPGDRFAMQIPLDVYPPGGGAPYQLNYVFPTARMKAAITAGMEVPVKVDPNDPTRVAVQWDAQKAEIAAAGGDMAAVQAGLAATYSGTADAAMRTAMAGGGAPAMPGAAAAGGDPLQQIEQLAKLRDSGVLTEEEFASKKADLLGKM